MRPEENRPAPSHATRQSLLALPLVAAVAVLAVFVVRDGFGWGDVLGAVIIGFGVCAVLVLLRRFNGR